MGDGNRRGEEGLIINFYFYSELDMGTHESSNVFPAVKLIIFVLGGISVADILLVSRPLFGLKHKNNLQFGAAAVWLKPG